MCSRLTASRCAVKALLRIAAATASATAMHSSAVANTHGSTSTSSAPVNTKLVRKCTDLAVPPSNAVSASTCSVNALVAWIKDGRVSSSKGGTNFLDDTDEIGVGFECAVDGRDNRFLIDSITIASLHCRF